MRIIAHQTKQQRITTDQHSTPYILAFWCSFDLVVGDTHVFPGCEINRMAAANSLCCCYPLMRCVN